MHETVYYNISEPTVAVFPWLLGNNTPVVDGNEHQQSSSDPARSQFMHLQNKSNGTQVFPTKCKKSTL